METLILAADPGSASRKYALYNKSRCLVSFHFEYENDRIICTRVIGDKVTKFNPKIKDFDECPKQILPLLEQARGAKNIDIKGIGLRVVAPTGFFLKDHLLNDEVISHLTTLESRVPLHIKATLAEAKSLQKQFNNIPIGLISDSAYHYSKPDYAWNYPIKLEDADQLEIKRFGYHGISVFSVVRDLAYEYELPEKLIVCHLGSGSSVTAVINGESFDTTMGYSPLDGLMMASRSGSIDAAAALALKKDLKLTDNELEIYLNENCGLFGISGFSNDIRELVDAEAKGHYRAKLALAMYVYKIQQAIGQMAAAMGGVDGLIFTGTVGDRSFIIRKRIIDRLEFLNLALQTDLNEHTVEPQIITRISPRTRQKPIYVISTDELHEISRRTISLIKAKR